jgi:DNA-binding transcriptional LysR family regulator
LNTQKIKILLTAIDKGSLTRAGQALGYTQSYLTQTMKAFEEEVGFPLLVKTNRGVEPTQEARTLLPTMRRLVECEERFEQEKAELQGLRKGTIRIGTYVSTSVYWVPQIIEYFQNNYPQVVFQIEELGHDEMIDGLIDGSLDIALMSFPGEKTNIDFIPVIEDPMMVTFPPDHELSKYDYEGIRQIHVEKVS